MTAWFQEERVHPFLGMESTWEAAEWVLWGIPMDFTASFQSGSRFGPEEVRAASYALETFSWLQQRSLEDTASYDGGDLELPIGNVDKSLGLIRERARYLLAQEKHWCAIGGEHLVSLPLVEAALERWPDLVVVHWDAHADLRDSYLGEHLSHATVLRRIWEHLLPGHLYQFGIRSGDADEWAFLQQAGIHHYPFAVAEPLREVRAALQGRPIYLTLDLDVLDPAFFPGTGTPEPGGITPQEAFTAIQLLAGLHVVGMDFVEAMPKSDISRRTAILTAKIVREALLAVTKEAAS